MLADFCKTANAIAATTKKSEKERLLAGYLAALDDASLERAVVFFSGSAFPRKDQRTVGVGGAALSDAIVEVTGRPPDEVWSAWSKYGDAGDTVAELFKDDPTRTVTLAEVGETFERLAATSGSGEKKAVLVALLRKLDAQGVRFVVKILLREFRIGLQEGLVESAIAKAFARPLAAVRRANMLTGDIGAAALLARSDALDSARMNLFHPFAFMLAQPEEDPDEIAAMLGAGAFADDKYDGVRAQIHASPEEVRIYSRTLDDVTHRFPELEAAARKLGHSAVVDGEIVAFSDRVLPFATIQKRLGRRKVSEALLRDAPVVFFAFDLLFLDGDVLFEVPLRERLAKLRGIVGSDPAIRFTNQTAIRDGAHVDELFDAARARANEGLVIKAPDSVYTPGRRGKSWLKYKKALATLDCVVTAAEYGHGKRRAVLSDVTFAVRRDNELVNIGKAYSGLTDAEIARLTEHFQATTTGRYGPVLTVEPTIVLEIAFDRIQESKRHKSGYALRFPRIAHLRDDKTVDQISTIDEVRRIYEGQLKREAGSK
ncbi:MAG: ATP-dependent DNA ligase [Acidobacteria bacterium]|nr:ATP-dependent DNA ligase [Acidobacteriota bacterium]MBV9184113.1 ATP-dependent DNA ligase [Acidobacteriota bacterium]